MQVLGLHMDLSTEVIQQYLDSLDSWKSQRPDGVHPRVFKELAGELVQLLSIVFKASWRMGVC